MAKILIAEDDLLLCESIVELLEIDRHLVEFTSSGKEAIERVKIYSYDLLVLDWELPEHSGLEICQLVRMRGKKTPVLFITGRSELGDKLEGYEAGADDYLSKPFDVNEFRARVRTLLRRNQKDDDARCIAYADIVLNPETFQSMVNGKDLELLRKEFLLLELLLKNKENNVSVESIKERVWGSSEEVTDEALRTCIKRLRNKLDNVGAACKIKSAYGSGYRLEKTKADTQS